MRYGQLKSAELLAEHATELSVDTFGQSLLHLAVQSGEESVVERFEDDENVIRAAGDALRRKTPLHLAFALDDQKLSHRFLTKITDLRYLTISDAVGVTPIAVAIAQEDLHSLNIILDKIPCISRSYDPEMDRTDYEILFLDILDTAISSAEIKAIHVLLLRMLQDSWHISWILEIFSRSYRFLRLEVLIEMIQVVEDLEDFELKSDPLVGNDTFEAEDTTGGHSVVELSGRDSVQPISHEDVGKQGVSVNDTGSSLYERVCSHLRTSEKTKESTLLIWSIQNENLEALQILQQKQIISTESHRHI